MMALIVEDEAILAMSLSMDLEDLGHKVCACVSRGAEALLEYRRHKPDIIFMDILLEGEVGGVEAAGQIREDTSIPIIFVTASTDVATLRAVDEIVGTRLLKKPYTSDDLAGILSVI
jgi:two-component system, response regulator PdtaR